MPGWLVVVLIVVGVALLAALRAWTWVHKERLMREAGGLLHRPEDGSDSADASRPQPGRRSIDPD